MAWPSLRMDQRGMVWAVLGLLSVGVRAQELPPLPEERPRPGAESVLSVPGYDQPIRLFLPSDFRAGKRFPLILHLHGMGGSPTAQPWIEVTGGKGYLIAGLPYGGLRDGGAQGITDEPADVRAMIAYLDTVRGHLAARYGADPGRVVLSGISMGGWAVNYYGMPKSIRVRYRGLCILSAAPLRRKSVDFSTARGLPVLIVNGVHDENVLLARKNVPELQKAGARVTFIQLPGEGHSPGLASLGPPLRAWLLALP